MSKSSTAARRLPNREAALESLYSDISAKSMFPFWATSTDVAHDEIKQLMGTQKAVPHRWSYKNDIEPILFRAAELVTMSDSERRSLILVNPGLSPQRATVSTLYTAYRLNDPNEVMPPHRHSPNAIYFEHDYREMVDGQLVKKKLQSARVPSDYSQRIYGRGGLSPRFVGHDRGTGAASPMYVYRWEPMRELLEQHKDWDGDPHEALLVEYVDPLRGGPVYKTMTFFMQMLRPGERT